MAARIQGVLAVLALMTLGGCAMGTQLGHRLGWTSEHALPSDAVRASCRSAVATLQGKPDYETALQACTDAKSRQHVN